MDAQNLPQTDILVYQGDAGLKMSVKTDGETVWLTQDSCSSFAAAIFSASVGSFGWGRSSASKSFVSSMFMTPSDFLGLD